MDQLVKIFHWALIYKRLDQRERNGGRFIEGCCKGSSGGNGQKFRLTLLGQKEEQDERIPMDPLAQLSDYKLWLFKVDLGVILLTYVHMMEEGKTGLYIVY